MNGVVTERARIDALLAVDDHRRPGPRAAAVARRLGVLGNVPTMLYAIAQDDKGPIDIVDVLGHRGAGAVLVMDAHGGGFPGDRLRDVDVEAAIAAARIAVLAIGPNADTRAGPDALVVAIDRTAPGDAALDFGMRWRNTFSPATSTVVVLEAPSGWAEGDDVDDVLVGHGFDGLAHRVVTGDPAGAICAAAAAHTNPVIVVAAPGTRASTHWFATARRLIRSAPCPVAVVPNHG